jgi:aminoglycoside phosphotransferase (APT) family kinase protein
MSDDNFGIDPALIDFGMLDGWMREQGLPYGAFERVEKLAGGTQNVLVRFTRGGRTYVLRRGPPHLRPRSNDIMRREAQVLTALRDTEVPHPGFIAGCMDENVMGGAVFYLMEPVDGFNPGTGLPALHASDPAIRHEMGLQIADGAAALGAVDHTAVGLSDLGKPEGFLERQVPRWLSELESYGRFEGYPGPEIPGVERVAAWLDDNRPATFAPGIMHGDYHFSNVMYAYDSARLVAIVDWEMCTVGDPLLDLGWLLATWPDPDRPSAAVGGGLAAHGGLPSKEEVVARYGEHSARDVSAVDWYAVLACFKLGIVLEGTNARAFAGKAPRAVGDMLHATTLGLFERATALISRP